MLINIVAQRAEETSSVQTTNKELAYHRSNNTNATLPGGH
jgi:hypothetical protein